MAAWGRIARATVVLTLALAGAGGCGAPAPDALDQLPVVSARVGTTELRLALADDHATGLAGIDTLGAVDGMLFDYGTEAAPAAHPFWMAGVRFPLDIAFFAADGELVDRVTMAPCPDDRSCPRHVAARPFRWVVETRPGAIGAGGPLVLPGAPVTP